MTRTTLYKAWYFAVLAASGAAMFAVLWHYDFAPLAFVLTVLAFLVPGRILGYLWRDLLRGLRLLNARDYAASTLASERFLVEVRRRPWLKHAIWLGTSTYSRDPEVLALNNLGAAELRLGEMDSARRHLGEAIALDGLCPLPFYNLGLIAKAADDMDEAGRCFAQAAKLGFASGLSDKIVRSSQTRLANVDGR